MHLFRSWGHVVGGTLLIAATAIGVGMLAMPVATAQGGFLPAVVIYSLCWLFMLATGLLFLEACLWMPKGANLITMVDHLLGKKAKIFCWFVYLFLFVTVMIAHVVAGGDIFNQFFGHTLPFPIMALIYVAIFFPFVYFGARAVDRFNFILMSGVIISYLCFIVFSISHVQFHLLEHVNWNKSWLAIPILFTGFCYQVIIPTLVNYMERNAKKVRLAIIIGASLPFVVYLLWEFLILGIVPLEGPHGLIAAELSGSSAIAPLKAFTGNGYLFTVSKAFAFFTMTASYIALALSFVDFLADGLKVQKKGWNTLFLALTVFVPPTVIAIIYPGIFLKALGYAGGISVAILFGIFPPLMVWMGRYVKKYPHSHEQLPGGKALLVILLLAVSGEVILEAYQILAKFF